MDNTGIDVLTELSDLIENLTSSGSRTLDQNVFKRVKSICKFSDENVRHLYRMVMAQLEKRHSEIRLSAFQIINEIFSRSHAFRELLVDDFQNFLALVIGVNSKKPLPEPRAVASLLRDQAFKAIENWHQKYGRHYIKLALGYKYLTRVKKFNFEGSQSRTEVEQQRAQDMETRQANLVEKKLNTVLTQMGDSVGQIQNTVTEIESCFQLLLPSPEEFDIYDTNSKSETGALFNNESPSTSSRQTHSIESSENLNDHGVISRSHQLNITLSTSVEMVETDDNVDVLNTLRELLKLVIEKYLPLTQKWLEVLTKHSGHHENLVQAIDLKNLLTELKYKFDKLRIISNWSGKSTSAQGSANGDTKNKDDEMIDDEFVEVPEKEGVEHVPENRRHEYGLKPVKNTSLGTSKTAKDRSSDRTRAADTIMWNPNGNLSTLGDPSSRMTAIAALLEKYEKKGIRKASKCVSSSTITRPNVEHEQDLVSEPVTSTCGESSETNKKRAELLKKAPVVTFDMDLYNWERKEEEAPSVSDLKSLHCYWTRGNDQNEDHCPGDIREAMKSRSIPFAGKFQEIKWACRAPLPSGKLCPRKDRYKCPFHGKIIPRDAMGRPDGSASDIDEPVELRSREIDEVTRDIEQATGMDLGSKKEKRGKKRKHSSGLTDLKKNKNSSRARLEKIVLNKAALVRVAEETNRVRKSLIDEKFGNNWNYALKP